MSPERLREPMQMVTDKFKAALRDCGLTSELAAAAGLTGDGSYPPLGPRTTARSATIASAASSIHSIFTLQPSDTRHRSACAK